MLIEIKNEHVTQPDANFKALLALDYVNTDAAPSVYVCVCICVAVQLVHYVFVTEALLRQLAEWHTRAAEACTNAAGVVSCCRGRRHCWQHSAVWLVCSVISFQQRLQLQMIVSREICNVSKSNKTLFLVAYLQLLMLVMSRVLQWKFSVPFCRKHPVVQIEKHIDKCSGRIQF